jgi:hypothetical protein
VPARCDIMQHALFGNLTHHKDEFLWRGEHKFPVLAAYDVYYGEYSSADVEEAEAKEAAEPLGLIDKGLDKLSQKIGDWIEKDMEEYDESREGDGDDAGEEAESRARFRRGVFPIELGDSKGKGPTPEQEKAFRELVDNEAHVINVIMRAIFEKYREMMDADPTSYNFFPKVKSPADLKKMLRCEYVHVSEYHKFGVAYLGFYFDCLWDTEHGLGVLWLNDHVVEVGDSDTVLDAPDADNSPENIPPTPHQELVNAVFEKNESQIQRLLDQGVNINALDDGEIPPLILAGEQLDVPTVKRLLELGADPNLKDYEGKTALQRMKMMEKTLDLSQKSVLMRLMMRLAQWFNPGPFNQMRKQVRRVIDLLESRGAK